MATNNSKRPTNSSEVEPGHTVEIDNALQIRRYRPIRSVGQGNAIQGEVLAVFFPNDTRTDFLILTEDEELYRVTVPRLSNVQAGR